MGSVRAVQAGAYVSNRLKGLAAPARLIAVFERYAYIGLTTDGGMFVLALSNADAPPGPLTIAVDCWPVWSTLLHASGHLEADVLQMGNLDIALEGATVWPSAATRLTRADPSTLAERLSALLRLVPHHSELLSGVLFYKDILSKSDVDFESFGSGLRQRDIPAIARGAETLVGLGRGLTPSGDDFLCGVATALWVYCDAPEAPCAALVDAASGRTTSLSRAFLASAAEGHVNAQWQALLSALRDQTPETILVQRLTAVMAMGHSSGADTMAGFIWASRLIR